MSAPPATRFVAEVVPVDPGTAPLEQAVAEGFFVAGQGRTVAALGTAAVLHLPDGLSDPVALAGVTAWLRSVALRGETGSGTEPVVTAVGAFPFDPVAPAALTVPATTWFLDAGGRGWRVDVRRASGPGPGEPAPEARREPAPHARREPAPALGAGPRLTEVPPGVDYADAVARAVADIAAGRLRKVVLSRAVDLRLPRAPAPPTVLERLWGGDGVLHPYAVPVGGRRMVGASPELLVARQGEDVASHAFAGTVGLSDGDAGAVDRLLASAKDQGEHRLVVEAVAAALEPRCARLDVPATPSVVRLHSDARLGSLLEGTLRGDDSALELLGLLHPTPAVGGVPTAAALRRIAQLEAPRGSWAGALGWVDAAGDGHWVLAIRNAVLDGDRAIVRAGAGIVAESDPKGELAETTVKLSPVLDALWPGASSLL